MLLFKVFLLFIYVNFCCSLSIRKPSDEKFSIEHYKHENKEVVVGTPLEIIEINQVDQLNDTLIDSNEVSTNLLKSSHGIRIKHNNETRLNSSEPHHFIIHHPHHHKKNHTNLEQNTANHVLNSTNLHVFNPNKSVAVNATREIIGVDNTLRKIVLVPTKNETKDAVDYYGDEDYYDYYDDDYYYDDYYYDEYNQYNAYINNINLIQNQKPTQQINKHPKLPHKKANAQIKLSAKIKKTNLKENSNLESNMNKNNMLKRNRLNNYDLYDYYERMRKMLKQLRPNRYNLF